MKKARHHRKQSVRNHWKKNNSAEKSLRLKTGKTHLQTKEEQYRAALKHGAMPRLPI